MKEFKLTIEKVGRKWAEATNEYRQKFKVEINETLKELLKESNEICILGDYENKTDRFGVKREITNVTTRAKKEEAEKRYEISKEIKDAKSAIEKMLFYVEEAIKKEYWYKNGEVVILEKIEILKKHNINANEAIEQLNILKQKLEDIKTEQFNRDNKSKTFIDFKQYSDGTIVENNKKIVSSKNIKLSKDDIEVMFGLSIYEAGYTEFYEYTYESC